MSIFGAALATVSELESGEYRLYCRKRTDSIGGWGRLSIGGELLTRPQAA